MKIWHGLGLLGLGLAAAAVIKLDALKAFQPGLGAAPPAPTVGLQKCLADGRVIYTDGSCPAGSRPQALDGGTLSVVSSPPPPARAAAPGQPALPHARDALLDPQGVDIRQRRMDAVIGQ